MDRHRCALSAVLAIAALVPVAAAAAPGRAPGDDAVTRLVVLDAPTRWDAWAAALEAGGVAADGAPEDAPAEVAISALAAADAAEARIRLATADVENLVAASGGTVVARYDTALAGLLVRLPTGAQSAVAGLPGVRRVAAAPRAEVHLVDSVPGIGAARVAAELGIDGAGATIAVVDSGIDYTHAAFGGPGTTEAYTAAAAAAERIDDTWAGAPLFPNARVVAGWDFAGPLYDPSCTPEREADGRCTVDPRPDPDPLDRIGHGTHVAGIAAGRAIDGLGAGVAPGAALVALKIFGASGATELIVDPLEWAIEANMGAAGRPRIDVLNLSLGQPYGGEVLEEEAVIRRAVDAGIVVVASAGNDRQLPFIVSAPAVAADALAVASFTPPGQVAWTITLRSGVEPPVLLGDQAVFHQIWSPEPRAPVTAPIAYVGRGCPRGDDQPEDRYEADPAGQIAMIELPWGAGASCTVSRQALRAQEAGAVAVVVAEKVGGEFAFSWVGAPVVDLPVWTANAAVEMAVIEAAASETPLAATLAPVARPGTAGTLSRFSSRGPSRTWTLKPDLAAPGGKHDKEVEGRGIFSAAVGQGRRGFGASGTSMAAPHAAGTAALVWAAQRRAGRTLAARDVAAIVVNTADPAGLFTSVDDRTTPPLAAAGSGALDAWAAARAETVMRAGPIARLDLGFAALSEPAGRHVPVTVTNLSATARQYAIGPHFRDPADVTRGLALSVDEPAPVIGAGQTRTLTVTATVDPAGLAPWALDDGSAIADLAALERSELDGWIEVAAAPGAAGDPSGTLRVPFYLLARRASAVRAERAAGGAGAEETVRLINDAPFGGAAELFTLVATDPAEPDALPKVDLDAVGVRAHPTEDGTTVLEFALHTRGTRPYPLETATLIELDTDLDQQADFRVYTADEDQLRTPGGVLRNGRLVVALEPVIDPFGPVIRYYATVDLESRHTILPILVEDTGLTRSTVRFGFRVQTQDLVERDVVRDPQYDQVPDGRGWLVFDGRPAARTLEPAQRRVDVPGGGSETVAVAHGPGYDAAAAPGLLVLFPANAPGAGDHALLHFGSRPAHLPWAGHHAHAGR